MQNGFSLLEVMIAMTVLALVAAGMGQALLQGQQHAWSIEQDRRIRSRCQSLLMELVESEWTPSSQEGTIEYMRDNSPLSFEIRGVPGETGTVEVTDVSTSYAEKLKTGSVYRIQVTFRQHTFAAYVENVP